MKIAVFGLGYVGLPLAVALTRHHEVIGFDIDEERIRELRLNFDRTSEESCSSLKDSNLNVTSQLADVAADVFIVTVPTPVNSSNKPILAPLSDATGLISKLLKKGDLVIYESTVYPGCTEDFCVPILEKGSKLNFPKDFSVGYSPERINPGDKLNKIDTIIKVVSGNNSESLKKVTAVYQPVVKAGLHQAPSIKVAEAAKIVENTQRDINIAFMNEMSVLFNEMNISTLDVIAAASTKWNFLNFKPGLVGGHCISVDPYYLIDSAENLGVNLKLTRTAREVSENIPLVIYDNIMSMIGTYFRGAPNNELNVHVEGVTFKEDCPDVRNSKIFKVVELLKNTGVNLTVADQVASEIEVQALIGKNFVSEPPTNIDVFIATLGHDYMRTEAFCDKIEAALDCGRKSGIVIDIKGMFDDLSSHLILQRPRWKL